MRANDVVRALEKRHKDDLHFTEMTTGSGRMDFWAMPRSWSKFGSKGYEIKVTRQDFERDDKWPSYVKACHYFSFACPWGLIDPSELPDGIGLLWVNKSGSAVSKKRAVHSKPDQVAFQETLVRAAWGKAAIRNPVTREAVSYTHLTLPTICSV